VSLANHRENEVLADEEIGPSVKPAVRTLIAAGYLILKSERHPRFIEIHCEHSDILGARIPYTFAVTEEDELTQNEIDSINYNAESNCSIPIIVTKYPRENSISWEDFTEALGGVVPKWHSLSSEYHSSIKLAAKNQLPPDSSGEAWLIFEDLVADGLEFTLGRRVRRLGGRKRNRTVSDILAKLPSGEIIVIDAKASENGFNAIWPSLRPLVEYTIDQQARQKGQYDVIGSIIVSSIFNQDNAKLHKVSQRFWGETKVPLNFITQKTLSEIVRIFSKRPDARNGINWLQIFNGGIVSIQSIEKEIKHLDELRIRKDE